MKKAEEKSERLANLVPCHCFNKDYSRLALSPNNKSLIIFKSQNGKWIQEQLLEGHDSFISGIDWSPVTDLIVTCGHDRNAYVWKSNQYGVWEPELVILRINRAATCVKWSFDGKKFAVGSSAKCVPVCHYEEAANWWISKMIKGHKSTVTCVDWHPNNKLILTGSTDKKIRVFSAFDSEVDNDEDTHGFLGIWPNQFEFGSCLLEIPCGGWVESVSWAPGGYRFSASSHDSAIHFIQILGEGDPPFEVQTIKMKNLPFRCMAYLNDDCVVAAGNDCSPFVYTAEGDPAEPQWSFLLTLDEMKKEEVKAPKSPKAQESAFDNVRSRWQGATSQGHNLDKKVETKLKTRHQNLILCICKCPQDHNDYSMIKKFTTSGLDGMLLEWDLQKMKAPLKQMKFP